MSFHLTAYSTKEHIIAKVIIYDGGKFCLLEERNGWEITQDGDVTGDKNFLWRAISERGFKLFQYQEVCDWFSEPPNFQKIRPFEREALNVLTSYNGLTYASQKFPNRDNVDESYRTTAYIDLLNACEAFFEGKVRNEGSFQEIIKLFPWKFISLCDEVSRHLAHNIPTELSSSYREDEKRRIIENVSNTLNLIDERKRKKGGPVDNLSIATRFSRQLVATDTLKLLDDKREWLAQAKKFIVDIGLTEESIKRISEQVVRKDHDLYVWYTYIGDINRLLFKAYGEECYFINACRAYNLAKGKAIGGKGIPLVLSRLADSFISYLRWLNNKDPSEVGRKAAGLIDICNEWLNIPTTNLYTPYVKIAEAYAFINDYPNSYKYYEEAIHLKPLDVPAYIGLGNLMLEQGNVLEAIDKLDAFRNNVLNSQYEERKRSSNWLEFLSAMWLYESGFFELCLNRLRIILTKTQPRNLEAGKLLVSVFSENPSEEFRQGFLSEVDKMETLTTAQAYVVHSLLGLPEGWGEQTRFDNQHEYLAQYYFELAKREMPSSNDWEKYIRVCEKHNYFLQVKDPGKEDIVIWDRLGRIYLLKGDIDKARGLFKELQEIPRHRNDSYIPFRLAQCFMREGNYAEAIEYLQKAYNICPRFETLSDIGFCFIMNNNPEQAKPYFDKILTDHPGDPLALYSLGLIEFGNNNYQKAVDKWIESLENKVRISDELEGRKLYEATRTTDALLTCYQKEPSVWPKIFNGLKGNLQLAELLIDRLSALSIFDSNITNEILQYYENLIGNNRLKRRVAQYFMGRSIFLVHGLIPDETPGEWIKKVAEVVTEPNFRAEFLAGAKSSYRKALRGLVASETIKDSVKKSVIDISNFSDTGREILQAAKIYDHICGTANNTGYYRTAENLFTEARLTDEEFIRYAQLQIKGFANKMMTEDNVTKESLLALCNGISGTDTLEESMNLLAVCPSIPTPLTVGNFVKQIQSRGENIDFYSNFNGKQESINNISIWIDDVAVKKLMLWCVANSDHAKYVKCSYNITKDGSLTFTFSTQFTWPEFERFKIYLQRNAIVKLPQGFELLESTTLDVGLP